MLVTDSYCHRNSQKVTHHQELIRKMKNDGNGEFWGLDSWPIIKRTKNLGIPGQELKQEEKVIGWNGIKTKGGNENLQLENQLRKFYMGYTTHVSSNKNQNWTICFISIFVTLSKFVTYRKSISSLQNVVIIIDSSPFLSLCQFHHTCYLWAEGQLQQLDLLVLKLDFV